METKNDEERIVVNGGCFPLHWVRKFFNIATDDIEDNAVTEAKLSEAVVTKIGQAITGMKMTFDAVSGTVTLTDNAGNTVRLSVTAATENTAGLMSAADKANLAAAQKGIQELNVNLEAAETMIREDMDSLVSMLQDSDGELSDRIYALTARVAALENGGGTCGCTDIPDDEVDKILT